MNFKTGRLNKRKSFETKSEERSVEEYLICENNYLLTSHKSAKI